MLFAVEWSVRLTETGFIWGHCTGFLRDDPSAQIQFLPRENFRGYASCAWVETNEFGLRNGPMRERIGRKRLLLLGDSVLFGYGVKNHQTLSTYLEELLNRASREPVDVLNAGTSGYATMDETARGNALVPLLRPDAAIYVLVPNDIEAYRYKLDGGGNPRGLTYVNTGRECSPSSPIERLEYWLLRNSHLYNIARFSLKRYRVSNRISADDNNQWYDSSFDYSDAQWARWSRDLDSAAAAAAQWKIPVAFFVISTHMPNLRTHERVLAEIEKRGFIAWSTLPEAGIINENTTPDAVKQLHLWWDIHPNPEGHRFLAGILADRMQQAAWPPDPTAVPAETTSAPSPRSAPTPQL